MKDNSRLSNLRKVTFARHGLEKAGCLAPGDNEDILIEAVHAVVKESFLYAGHSETIKVFTQFTK